jgi:trans-2,3-dihydro-3-hydroxyanthranilate isomerase
VASYRYVIADVFTDTPLTGNQLAVFTDARDMPEPVLQLVAREMNLSETVFVYPAEGDGHVRIRIFTPAIELPFAGHPVLGSAFVLAGPLQLEVIHLETGVGIVPVRLERREMRIVFGWMEQPYPAVEQFPDEARLLEALHLERSELPVELYDNGPRFVYVALAGEEQVAVLAPEHQALRGFDVGVSCFAGSGDRWKTRMFAPSFGVAEDPATGSAAGPLVLHLVRHGLVEPGAEIRIAQGSEVGRPSTLHARADDDSVEVGGSAVIVARGEFRF